MAQATLSGIFDPMLITKDLSYRYQGASDALAFPDLDIAQGHHTLIIGPSGCGKTTFLHLLAGLRSPSSGSIRLMDTDITSLSTDKLDSFRGQHIGMIFQVPHFMRSLNVNENLALAQSLAGKPTQQSRIDDCLKDLNLIDKKRKKTSQLSVGEQQRVAIIRAVINQPKIIFADEPTSALDDQNTEQVINLLKDQANSCDATLIVVTHDQRLKDNFTNRIEL